MIAVHEYSASFDLAQVEPFLRQLESHLNLGLDVVALVDLTSSTPVETEVARSCPVVFDGDDTILEYRVFKDDIEAPDLYFSTSSVDLSRAIASEVERFMDEAETTQGK